MKTTVFAACLVCLLLSPSGRAAVPTPDQYRALADQTESSLKNDVLAKWFPAAIDKENGGFTENFREDWSPGASGEKSIVYQCRLTWLSAQAAVRYPAEAK